MLSSTFLGYPGSVLRLEAPPTGAAINIGKSRILGTISTTELLEALA